MPASFVEIILCKDKSELKKLCKTSTISMKEFTNFIILCKAGLTHLNHTMHYFDFVPSELEEREDDWEILNSDKEIQTSIEGKKALNRLFKSHGMRRQYRVGHMFISKELFHPITEWHFIFFELKELHAENNHWERGQHIHLTNYLWPNLYCQKIWEKFLQEKQFPKSKLHLSCVDETRN